MTYGHGSTDLSKALEVFYNAVSRAQALGYFTGHHGPLEETAWVHLAIHNLEAVERVADEAIKGDVRQLSRLKTMLEAAPKLTLTAAGHQDRQQAKEAPILDPHHAALVASAALLIDRLQDQPGTDWTRKAMGYYTVRAMAVNAALTAGTQAHAGQLPLQSLAAVVKSENFMAGRMAQHGNGHAQLPTSGPPSQGPAASGGLILDAAHAGTLGATLDHVFRPVLEIADSGQAMTTSVMLETLAGSHHLDEECCGRLRTLAGEWEQLAPGWKERLFPPAPGRRGPAVVRRPMPVVEPGEPGQPQDVGRWEIAELSVTETDELCPVAQGSKDLSSKIYGWAGNELTKAQNEITNAQQCINGADSRRCKQEEDRGYKKCAEERDEGYDNCARKEDHGHNECCDWEPCSWFCDALVWIVNLVCVLWEWISHIVCVVWVWITKMVCVAWEYIKAAVCAAGHIGLAIAHGVAGAGGIGAGAAMRGTATLFSSACKFVGAKPASRTASALKLVGIHVAVLHTNKVLLFSYDEGVYPVSASNPADFTAVGDSDRGLSAVWDPATKTAKYIPLKRNLFCAHQSFAEDGRLLVAGGQFPLPGLLKSLIPPKLLAPGADKDLHIFDPITETWTRYADMDKGRWYPTCTTLLDGRVFISSGTNGWAAQSGLGRGIQDTWQIADPATGNPGVVVPFGHHLFHLYPFQHVLPGGNLFIHFKRTTILYDPRTGARSRVAARGRGPDRTGATEYPYSRTGPGPGTCCLLPLIPKYDPTNGQVRYPAGRILILGGGGAEKEGESEDPTDEGAEYELHSDVPATNTAEILDFDAASREWVKTTDMQNGRVMPDSILLPNAKVLVIGGGRFGQSGGLLAHFTSTDTSGNPDKGATDPVFEPEMYDPVSTTWTLLARKPLARLYHTTAALLPDARVLVAGHDGALNMPPYDTSRYELEIFSPPYLFGSDGQPAPRPVITDAPAVLPLGNVFEIKTPNAALIKSVALIRQSSTTHQINTDQRYIGLAIVDQDREKVIVRAPAIGDVAVPGYYMLFLVNTAGVPSMARWMRVPLQA